MKVLFVNACLRGEASRTLKLAKSYLEDLKKARPDAEFEEVDLDALDMEVQDGDYIMRREVLINAKDFTSPMFDLAKQFIEAEHVVIAAPYWDLSFPAKLKMYLERCSVDKLTFVYEKGVPQGMCKAECLTYITTAGGYIGEMNYGFDYVKGLGSYLFGIQKFHFVAADGIDIDGIDVEGKLAEGKAKLAEIAKTI